MSELPNGWVKTTIRDLCELINGKAFKPSDWATSGLPIVRIQNLNKPNSNYNYYDGVVEEKFLIDGGQLLFAWSGTPGTSFGAHIWNGGKAVLNQHIFKVNFPLGLIDKHFLKNAINQKLDELIGKAHGGAGLQHITKGKFEETQILFPPLAEQKRIVAKLDALSAKSARARTELARLETLVSRYRQTVLSKAFSGELTREWRSGVNWPTPVRLGDVASSFAYGSAAKSQKTGSIPVLRMGNIQDGKLDWTNLVYTDDQDDIQRYRLVPGDVLFNRTNSPTLVGKTAMYSGEREAIFAGYLIRVAAGPSLNCRYLNHALNSPSGREFSWNVKTDGVSQSNISATKLKEFLFAVPSFEEQNEIVRLIESAFARIDRLATEAKRALELLGRLDEAILAKAFLGELVPQDETDEPARPLLEKIAQVRKSEPRITKRNASPRRGKALNMERTIIETLVEAKDWVNAQELFASCGVRDGSSTDDVEKLYRQLLRLERQKKVEIDEVLDPSNGTKQGNRVRLRK